MADDVWPDDVKALFALALVETCFRNTRLEDLHAGISPDSATGDYEDVKVVSPFGEIPWNRLSRLSDEEMKALMIEAVNKVYTFVSDPTDLLRLGGAARAGIVTSTTAHCSGSLKDGQRSAPACRPKTRGRPSRTSRTRIARQPAPPLATFQACPPR